MVCCFSNKVEQTQRIQSKYFLQNYTSYHTRLSTSSRRSLMSNKPLAWASKLLLNAANFVGSINTSSLHSLRWCKSLSFALGLIYLLLSSSMLAVCTVVWSAPVHMAAIVRCLSWAVLSIIYLLHEEFNNLCLNTNPSLHTYSNYDYVLDLIKTIPLWEQAALKCCGF